MIHGASSIAYAFALQALRLGYRVVVFEDCCFLPPCFRAKGAYEFYTSLGLKLGARLSACLRRGIVLEARIAELLRRRLLLEGVPLLRRHASLDAVRRVYVGWCPTIPCNARVEYVDAIACSEHDHVIYPCSCITELQEGCSYALLSVVVAPEPLVIEEGSTLCLLFNYRDLTRLREFMGSALTRLSIADEAQIRDRSPSPSTL